MSIQIVCPCCNKSLMLTIAGGGSGGDRREADGIFWVQSVTKENKPCEIAHQNENLIDNQPTESYAKMYNWLTSTQKPFADGYFYWLHPDGLSIWRLKCQNKLKGTGH
jgi:hypothetical protein